MKCVYLNSRQRVIRVETISLGSINSNSLYIKDLFQPAIEFNSAAFIIAHNHPSEDPSPSDSDISFTKKAVKAGQLLSIQVLDHIVICKNCYVSLLDLGYFPK